MENKFEQQLSQLDIRLTERQKEQFHQYYELLVEWNKVMNLTGITEYDEVNEKHFVDSLAIVKTVDMNQVNSVIDKDCLSSSESRIVGFTEKKN